MRQWIGVVLLTGVAGGCHDHDDRPWPRDQAPVLSVHPAHDLALVSTPADTDNQGVLALLDVEDGQLAHERATNDGP